MKNFYFFWYVIDTTINPFAFGVAFVYFIIPAKNFFKPFYGFFYICSIINWPCFFDNISSVGKLF